ncbi:MAG: VPLPA-CTERM sorting domain-containing protein [Proteobacteria bacterium]|jgi:hypothetical protein|nr:VPLPA-CTERM sorting domain-containing protein [Pseudomonadota bacterium]
MKVSVLLAAFVALFSLSSAAQAAPIQLGNLSIGDEGNLSPLEAQLISISTPTGNISATAYGYATGMIPSMSKITFTYSFDPAYSSAPLYSNTNYTETGSITNFYYTDSQDNSYILSFGGMFPTINSNPESMLIDAIADASSGKTGMTNLSASLANFATYLLGELPTGVALTNVHWVVEAVPLPAALPLFGLGLAGLAGYSRRKKAAV